MIPAGIQAGAFARSSFNFDTERLFKAETIVGLMTRFLN